MLAHLRRDQCIAGLHKVLSDGFDHVRVGRVKALSDGVGHGHVRVGLLKVGLQRVGLLRVGLLRVGVAGAPLPYHVAQDLPGPVVAPIRSVERLAAVERRAGVERRADVVGLEGEPVLVVSWLGYAPGLGLLLVQDVGVRLVATSRPRLQLHLRSGLFACCVGLFVLVHQVMFVFRPRPQRLEHAEPIYGVNQRVHGVMQFVHGLMLVLLGSPTPSGQLVAGRIADLRKHYAARSTRRFTGLDLLLVLGTQTLAGVDTAVLRATRGCSGSPQICSSPCER